MPHDMRLSARLVLVTLISLAAVPSAWAEGEDPMNGSGIYTKESWPLETIQRPLTLAAGMAELRGDTLRVGISGGDTRSAGEPIVLAPDLYYGVSDLLTIGLTHTNHATFFPPAGFCVSGTENGCPKVYNAIGAEAQYDLTRRSHLDLAVRAGVSAGRFSPDFAFGATAGVQVRFKGSRAAVVLDPNVYIGIIERDTFPIGMEGASYPDYLFLPVQFQYQLNTQAMVFAMSGLNTPLKDTGDFFQIPAGVGANFAVNNRMDAGLELQLANVAGKDIGPEGAQIAKFDERYLIARIAIRI